MSNYPHYPNTPGSGNGPQSGGNSPYASGAPNQSHNYGSQPYGSQPTGGAGQQPAYGNSYANQSTGGGLPAGFGQPGPDGTVPLNQPHYGASMKEATIRFFKKYVRFNGFASRSEFWWPVLSLAIIQFALFILAAIGGAMTSADTGGGSAVAAIGTIFVLIFYGLFILFGLAVIVPAIAVTVRRLHDAGFSGWWYLLCFAPCGSIVVIIFCAMESKPEKWQPEWYDQGA